MMQTESHPFEPFLPKNARLLMLGTFPPAEKRWSMKFYYPNFTDNAPSWVQGSAPSECTTKDTEITYAYYTHTLTGGAFTGEMRLVKQGDGTLVLPNVTETYTGNTDVWAGTLQFDGTMEKSPVWLNRFARLSSNGGKFLAGIKADYGSEILPGGNNQVGTINASSPIPRISYRSPFQCRMVVVFPS